MDIPIRDDFIAKWKKYFNKAELPIAFEYTDAADPALIPKPTKAPHRCVIADIMGVSKGKTLALDNDAIGCAGGRRYLGFSQDLRPGFEYFLSCGIEGKMEGERYKKSPELVTEMLKNARTFTAPRKYIVFKRWDTLAEADSPEAVIFFAPPDVLSGLFTLAGFEESDVNGVICPFSAGCGSIVGYPMLEAASDHPRAVLGMFDVSARPYVPQGVLTMAVPMKKFVRMIADMDESFLITESWAKINKRIG
ncbi:MAG: DUF169 domain-containing protein [Deltaproteobacteria bacterium]|nr:DUF169 domain-containing protein [Candidatus Zymogenaceae bacterium]